MKKLILSLVITILILSINSFATSNQIIVKINGTPIFLEQNPIIENNRTLTPMRTIFELLGCNVTWNNENQTISITRNDINIILTVDSNLTFINNERYILDVPPRIIKGRTFVPIRFVTESLGNTLAWDKEDNSIDIIDESVGQISQISTSTLVKVSTSTKVEKEPILELKSNTTKDYLIELEYGDRGLAVESLQHLLEGIHDIYGTPLFSLPYGQKYGYYGEITKESVSQLQQFLDVNWYLDRKLDSNNEIEPLGKWDKNTQDAYKKYLADPKKVIFNFDGYRWIIWPSITPMKRSVGNPNIVYFSQRDQRWAYKLFSTHNDPDQNIAFSACGPSTLSVVISTLTNNLLTPYDMCKLALKEGYRSEDDGVPFSSGFYQKVPKKFGLKSKTTDFNGAISAIRSGKIVIAAMNPGHFTKKGHYIIFDGITKIKDKEYLSVVDVNHCNSNYGNDKSILDYVINDGAALATFDVIKKEAGAFIIYYK